VLGRAAIAAGQEALDIATRVGHRGWTATAWARHRHRSPGRRRPAGRPRRLHRVSGPVGEPRALRLLGGGPGGAVCVALGDLERAGPLLARALAIGPELGRYEARWAAAELAASRRLARRCPRGDRGEAAEAGGALLYLPRLRDLAGE
jgi:hypothetical protein